MKIFLRFLILIFLTAGFLFGGYVVGWYAKFNLYDAWKIKQLKKQGDQIWQELLREALKDDVYGSQSSPEETFLMFLDALKKEDFRLAVKYFVGEQQKNWNNKISTLRQNNELEKELKKWDKVPTIWKKQKEGYNSSKNESFKEITFTFLDYREKPEIFKDPIFGKEFISIAGEFENSITFELNPITKVWKISSF